MPDFLLSPEIADLLQSYGLWVLFAVVAAESFGVPLPGETVLMSAALYAGSTGELGIVQVVLVAAAAAILGDNLGYLIGRSVGLKLLQRYGRYLHLNDDRVALGRYLFRRHGGKIVFFGRFIAFLRAFAAILAGINRMSWPRFLLMNALGGLAWAALVGGGAYVFGETVRTVTGPVGLLLLTAALAVLATGLVFFHRYEKELIARMRAAEQG